MKTYLVTGAAGFIGAALARTLLEKGNQVIIIDNLSTGFRSAIPAGAEFIKADCQDKSVYDKLVREQLKDTILEAIYHIAGQSSGEISFDDPVYDLQTNTQSTLLLLELALKTRCRRLLYASTMSVYGIQPDHAIHESAPCFPQSFYGVGKLASEHYLRIFEERGIRSTSLRLFNVYGPGQNLENLRQGMISIYLAQALRTGKIVVKGSADRYRDFVYIDDVVQAFLAVEKELATAGKVLNVCTGRRTTVGEVLKLLLSQIDRKIETVFEGSTAGDLYGSYGNPSAIKELTGWSPKTSLEVGVEKMVAWAK